MTITLNGTTGITTPDVTSSGSLNIDASAPDNSLVVDASGNVGVGVTPSEKLSVDGRVYVTGSGYISNPVGMVLGQYSSSDVYIQKPAGSKLSFWDNATNAQMTLDASGNLLVGTASSTGRFTSYRGDAGFNGYFDSASGAGSGIYAIGTNLQSSSNNANCAHLRSITQGVNIWQLLGNGTSTFSSDERLKKNIETARSGYLDDVVSLRVVKYNWHTDDDSTAKELGLIAQEVEQVFPSLVVEDSAPLGDVQNPKAIKTSVLPYILLKAIQEQQAIIDEQKTALEALTARVSALEAA